MVVTAGAIHRATGIFTRGPPMVAARPPRKAGRSGTIVPTALVRRPVASMARLANGRCPRPSRHESVHDHLQLQHASPIVLLLLQLRRHALKLEDRVEGSRLHETLDFIIVLDMPARPFHPHHGIAAYSRDVEVPLAIEVPDHAV